MRIRHIATFGALLLTSWSAVGDELQVPPRGPFRVAGLAPYQRPEGAPVIRELAGTDGIRARALRGISDPPSSVLAFLKSQGAWYTPFGEPGMPGYYDIRDLHHPAQAKTQGGR